MLLFINPLFEIAKILIRVFFPSSPEAVTIAFPGLNAKISPSLFTFIISSNIKLYFVNISDKHK